MRRASLCAAAVTALEGQERMDREVPVFAQFECRARPLSRRSAVRVARPLVADLRSSRGVKLLSLILGLVLPALRFRHPLQQRVGRGPAASGFEL